MGLVEQSCYLLRQEPRALLEADDPREALRAHILTLEVTRLQLEQTLLLLRHEQAELARRQTDNARRIALREREIRRALAVESDEAAREAIHGKRELVEIERKLEHQKVALAGRIAAIETDAAALVHQAVRARALRRTPASVAERTADSAPLEEAVTATP